MFKKGTMNREEINTLSALPLAELILLADKLREEFSGSNIELCNIMNAKSGLCDQDCKFCAQSSRHHTQAAVYPLKSKEEILEAAKRAKDLGAQRFDICLLYTSPSPRD